CTRRLDYYGGSYGDYW
nr:immunoglobulin heavy chain junction region [Mus musculus]